MSILAHTMEDAARVFDVARGPDPEDSYSREASGPPPALGAAFRFGVPAQAQREFFGDEAAAQLYARALDRLESLGGRRVEIDLAPFRAAADLLYEVNNLWLQARQEAASKDRDEFRLHREVCAGRMTLEQAQHDMLATWGPR